MNDANSSAPLTFDNSALVAAMEKIHAAMEKARESMAKFQETVSTIGESVRGVSAAFANMPGVEAFANGLKDAMEQGRQFADQAKQTGQSVSTMVELKQAFESAGVSGDSVSGALLELNKAMDDTNEKGKPAADAFAKLGLSIGDLKKMNGVEQFQAIIKGLHGLPDAAGRAAVAQKIFGDRAKEMMGALNDPKGFSAVIAGSSSYAQAMQDNAGSFKKVGEAVAHIQEMIQEFYTQVAGGLAPALQGIFDLIKKINLPEFGADLGRGIAFAFEAFKEGKAFEMIRLSLTIAFKESVNTLYRGILGAGAAAGVLFADLPKLLSDAFSMVTNPKYWEGVGKLFLGALKGIQGELTRVFFDLADALGNRLADLLDKIPMMKNLAEELRKAMNKGNDVIQAAAATSLTASQQLTSSGLAEVKAAAAPITNDVLNAMQAAKIAAQNTYKNNKITDPTGDQAKLLTVAGGVATGVMKTQQANSDDASSPPKQNTSPTTVPGTTTVNSNKGEKKPEQKSGPFGHFKAPDTDRYAKLGLFIGGAPQIQMPGLSEARRTAKASEESRALLKQVVTKLDSIKSSSVPVYG